MVLNSATFFKDALTHSFWRVSHNTIPPSVAGNKKEIICNVYFIYRDNFVTLFIKISLGYFEIVKRDKRTLKSGKGVQALQNGVRYHSILIYLRKTLGKGFDRMKFWFLFFSYTYCFHNDSHQSCLHRHSL